MKIQYKKIIHIVVYTYFYTLADKGHIRNSKKQSRIWYGDNAAVGQIPNLFNRGLDARIDEYMLEDGAAVWKSRIQGLGVDFMIGI